MCPAKFYHSYILKEKPSFTSWQAKRGIDVHDFCNKFYDNITFDEHGFCIDDNFLQFYIEKVAEETVPFIKNFLDFEAQRWLTCKELLPTNPKKLFIPLLRETKFVSKAIERVTIIDRLDLRLDGNYTLVEYKTEKFDPKSWKNTERRREICFEKSVPESIPEFRRDFPGQILDFVYYFPRSNDVFCELFNKRSITAMEKCVDKIQNDYILPGFFPCNVEYHCAFCEFSKDCPMTFDKELKV